MSKDEIINKTYYDLGGFGSIKATLEDAHKYDKNITLDDVKAWFNKNVEKKTKQRGMNSFIANEPRDEYQMDLMFLNDLKDPIYTTGLLMVDIFTNFPTVVPIKTKQIHDVAVAIEQAIEKMGGKPITIYSDNEGACF